MTRAYPASPPGADDRTRGRCAGNFGTIAERTVHHAQGAWWNRQDNRCNRAGPRTCGPQFDGQVRFLDFGMVKDAALVAGTIAGRWGSWCTMLIRPTASSVFCGTGACCWSSTVASMWSRPSPGWRSASTSRRLGSASSSTSRKSLLVEGEQIFELGPLRGATAGCRAERKRDAGYPAARLFTERAAAAGHRAEITDEDAEVLVEICGKLDGIALAIELAAVRVGTHGLREMVTLLDGRLKLEWRGRRTAPPRQQTLGATLDWSYGLISESERVVLRRLAIFAAPFTLQGATMVAGEEDDPAERIVDIVGATRRQVADRGTAGRRVTRYRLLDTTRAYATQKLAESGEATRASRAGMPDMSSTRWETTAADSSSGDQASRSRARRCCSPTPVPR